VLDDTVLKRIHIFDVGSLGEAEEIVATDPVTKAGRLINYGSTFIR